jgi:putative endonuclease
MAESHDLGQEGEELARDHLIKHGYKILQRNWTSGKLEIDIIAENKDFIIFVEVKTRTTDYHMEPRLAVTNQKQKSIILAAESYIRRYKIDKDSRFDIISIISGGNSIQIEHIEDAFYPTLR